MFMQLHFKNRIVWLSVMMVVGILAITGLALAQTATTAQKQTTTSAKKQAAASTAEQTTSAAPKLFIDAPAAILEKYSNKVKTTYSHEEVKRTRIVRINYEALKSNRIDFNLFPDLEVIGSVTGIRKGNPDERYGSKENIGGIIEGSEYSTFSLYVNGSSIMLGINMGKPGFKATAQPDSTILQGFITKFLDDSTVVIMELDRWVLYRARTSSSGNKELDDRQ
jgi:hypothetical protein